MQYHSETFEQREAHLFSEQGEPSVFANVGVILALSAIALSVAIIIHEDFAGRAESKPLGKYVPVADETVQLAGIVAASKTGEIQK